ncbi:MAG: tyrosine-type recombinase/integrase [Actinomycetota bacterium]
MAGGSLRLKREPDYWELRVYAGRDPVTGRKRYVSRTFRGGKRDANRALADLHQEVTHQGITADVTVDHLLSSHIDHLAARGRQVRTIDGYRTIARAVAGDPLGSRVLPKVKVKDMDDYYLRLDARGLSPATIQRYHALLNAAFRRAVAWDWVPKNVVQLASPPSVPRIARAIPTPEVVSALLMEARRSRNPENYLAFRLLAVTGARRGEICGLRWRSVDLDANTFVIREAVAVVAGGELITKNPKSHQIRTVSVDAETAQLLQEHRAKQVEMAESVGATISRDAFVLADMRSDASGATPVRPDRLTQAFARLCQRVDGAGGVRLHDLRHWFASTQLDAGEPLPAVAARIGDNVETLAKVYAHKGRSGDSAAAEEVSQLLGTR